MTKKSILIGLAALIVGIGIGRLFSGQAQSTDTVAENAQATEWTCSMHPQIRQPEAGDCPICGMDLIPVKNETGEGSELEIKMSPTAMQLADVRTAVVGTKTPTMEIRLNGKVQADERRVHSQSSHISGRIEELSINFVGEHVRAGQGIARIYSPELVTAQEEFLEAERLKDDYPQMFISAKEKLKNWKLSQAQIDEILANGKVTDLYPLRADQSGVVLEKKVSQGDYVSRGSVLYEVADLSRLWILFDVYEKDLNWVKKGSEVEFHIPSSPGESMKGVIDFIDPVINPKTRVAKARISYKANKTGLKPEMFVNGILKNPIRSEESTLVVPRTAVMWTGERSVVYVRSASESSLGFRMREVTLGAQVGDDYIIKEGLTAGEEIAVSGTFSIDAAAQLAGKASMMNPQGSATMKGHNHSSEAVEATTEIRLKAELNSEAKEQIQGIVSEYLLMKDALVSDDFETAKNHGSQMKSALERVDMKLLKGDAHMRWMEISISLSTSMEHMAHFSDIEQLRKALKPISEQMVILAKTFDPMDETIYVEFCPMADDNKGASWLSAESEVLNPYFGAKMLKCGKVLEELRN